MPNKKLRIGIIGVGVYAVFAHIPGLRETGQTEIVAISRRNMERLLMVQKAFHITEAFTDWHEMLEKVQLDAVVVSTPHHMHTEPTLAALEHGLHVLVEKPMALRSHEAWTMIEAAEKANRLLMVGYPSRLQGIWQTVKQALTAGAIGTIRQINLATCFYRRWFWESNRLPDDVQEITKNTVKRSGIPAEFFADWGHSWHNDPVRMGGGAFTDISTHHVDRVLWLAGAPAVEVVAMTESAGLPVECFVNVQARLANDILFSMTSADAVPQGIFSGTGHLMIVGDEGVLTDDAEGGIWIYRDGERKKLEAKFANRTVGDAFVSAILKGDSSYPQAFEGAYAVDFVEAMYRSAAEHQIIQVEDRRKK